MSFVECNLLPYSATPANESVILAGAPDIVVEFVTGKQIPPLGTTLLSRT